MTINKGSVSWLCFAWGVGLLLGVTVGINLPFVLFVVGTILMLIS